MNFKKKIFTTIDSTHKWAMRSMNESNIENLFIIAHHQTDGIGRKGDKWIDYPNKNLLGTFLFTPRLESSLFAQLLALSTIKLIKKLPLNPSFKWPNDILINGKKIAGIMCYNKGDRVAVSIGLNINTTEGEIRTIDIPATSIYIESNKIYNLEEIENDLINNFSFDLEQFYLDDKREEHLLECLA